MGIFKNRGGLVKLADSPADPLTRNLYSYLTLKRPQSHGRSPEVFGKWLTSGSCRSLIRKFRINGKKIFFLPRAQVNTAGAAKSISDRAI